MKYLLPITPALIAGTIYDGDNYLRVVGWALVFGLWWTGVYYLVRWLVSVLARRKNETRT